jgi:predicted nucleic acid-binding protein
MSYLIDTDTIARYLKGHPAVSRRVQGQPAGLHCSAVSLAELELWLTHWRMPHAYVQPYFAWIGQALVLNADTAVAQEAARMGSQLRTQGNRIPSTVD